MNNIPLQKPSLGKEEIDAVKEVFESGWLGLGSKVQEFEEELKRFLNAKYVVAVNSGTSALHLVLEAIGIGKGDEVILPSLTFVATAQAVSQTYALPVFCDITEDNLNADPEDIEEKISKKTKAIIVVHYRGMPCDMDKIMNLAKKYSLRVIEDASHAFGSKYKGRKIGNDGDIICFSFDPIKNITCGEGGAIVVQERTLYKKLLIKRQLGINNGAWERYSNKRGWKYDVLEVGYRYHLSNINAVIGICQLKKFKRLIRKKISIARQYDEAFSNIDGLRIIPTDYGQTAIFMYVIRILKNREQFIHALKSKGISTGIHYLPCHQFTFYRNRRIRIPITEMISEQIITLPLFSEMCQRDIDRVINSVHSFFHSQSTRK